MVTSGGVAQAGSPDDNPGSRGPGAIAAASLAQATSPDDGPDPRGPGAIVAAQDAPAVGAGAVASLRPDDRPEARGPGIFTSVRVAAIPSQPTSAGFDWDAALLGGIAGLVLALVMTGIAYRTLAVGRQARGRPA